MKLRPVLRPALLAGIAALLPVTAGPGLAHPAAAGAATFSPPLDPLVLTRTLWRSLHDGREIRVERRYAVRIRAHGDGFVVDGELIGSSVDAPPQLGALARIEQHRTEPGLFPLLLDRSGRIVTPHAGSGADAAAKGAAISQGRGLLAAAGIPAQARQQAQALLAPVMAAAGAGSAWPTDLFNPPADRRSERRSLALPGDSQEGDSHGEVTVTIAVDGRRDGTVPRSVERTVVTMLDGTRRVSREVWTITPR